MLAARLTSSERKRKGNQQHFIPIEVIAQEIPHTHKVCCGCGFSCDYIKRKLSKKRRPFIPCEGDSTGVSSNHGNEVHVVPIGQDPGTGGSYGKFGPPQPVIHITSLRPVPLAPNRASQIAGSGIPRVVFFFFLIQCF